MSRTNKCALAMIAGLALVASAGWAATSDSHTVTLNMNEVHDIAVTGGNLTLNMPTSATAGQPPASQVDSTAGLDYTVVESGVQVAKITIQMSVNDVPAGTSLTVGNDATGSEGTDAGDAVDLAIASGAVDFITSIGSVATGAGPTLTYTWDFDTVTSLDAADDQVVTITYTLVDGV